MMLTPPPMELISVARHADDLGALLFIVALILAGVGGWLWVRQKEQEQE